MASSSPSSSVLPFAIEVCIESFEGLLAAEAAGASRVELVQGLSAGGLTPSLGLLQCILKRTKVPVYAMLRPRSGDFAYTEQEFEVMLEDLRSWKDLKLPLSGIVFGILTPEGDIDRPRSGLLIAAAKSAGWGVTFHRAFDMTRDPQASLEVLVQLGVERVLTSGQESSCLEARGRIVVMGGGGLTARNIKRVRAWTGLSEFHLSGKVEKDGPMQHRNGRVAMGATLRENEYARTVTDEGKIRSVLNALHQ